MKKVKGVEEFRESCRVSFASVLARHGFNEEALPKTKNINEYQVRWANETTRIIVEGINWGLNIDVRLASVDDSVMEYKSYAFDDLLAIRNPTFKRKNGQSEQMEQYAKQLEEHAPDVLSGDHNVFPELAAAIKRRAEEFARRQ